MASLSIRLLSVIIRMVNLRYFVMVLPMGLYVKLLGGPVFRDSDGQVFRLPTRKSEAMLAYLVERRNEAISREVLASVLWPYSAEEQARASLRQEVSVLRKGLGPAFADLIVTEGDRISLTLGRVDADIWQIRDGQAETIDPIAATDLLDLYSAPFLDTFRIRSQPFSDWVWAARQAIETETLNFGQTVLKSCIETEDVENTQKIAQSLCRIEPTTEIAHRALIELYLRAGDDAAARRQLQICRTALKTELEAEVSDETLSLFETVKPDDREARASTSNPVQQRRFVVALSVLVNLEVDDPEDFETASDALTKDVRTIVENKGGTILQVSGDRVLACFGYPIGHDRDPEVALSAAQDVVDGLDRSAIDTGQCRVGLSYGQALFSGPADGEQAKYSGPVFREAEAISYKGPPATVLLDQKLEMALSPVANLEPVKGETSTKTVNASRTSHPQQHQILGPEQKYPMVGRDTQLIHLVGLLDEAKQGRGSAAAILAAPGEGKSRLVQEVVATAALQGFDCQIFQGSRSQNQSTFGPVLDYLFRAGAVLGEAATEGEIEYWLAGIDPAFVAAAPYIGSLIKKPSKDQSRPSDLSKDAKTAALNIFSAQIAARGRDRPLCLVFEDIHWFDPTTCEAISRLVEHLSDTPVLALLVSRKGEAPDVANHPFVHQIELAPLTPQSAETLLRDRLKDTKATDLTIKNILERSDGNPLILDEFAKSIAFADSENQGASSSLLGKTPAHKTNEVVEAPDRLMPLLLSRIDLVPGAIQVLQYASVFGRRFSKDQLALVAPTLGDWAVLARDLEAADIVFASQQGADTSFIFKHALIAEAIYATIPKRDRPSMHIAVAETLLLDRSRLRHSEVANHYRLSEELEAAAKHFELSGDQAARVSAFSEAISEYHEAKSLIERMPNTPERSGKELTLNRKIAAQLIALHGIPTSDAEPYFAEALRISTELNDDEESVNAAWGLWGIHLIVAELDRCLEIATDLEATIDKVKSPAASLIHQYMLGVTLAYRGSLTQAADCLEAALRIYNEDLKTELQMRFGMDIGLTANSFLGWVYALLERPKDADLATHRALQLADTNNNGLSRVFANVFTATKCLFLDQLKEAQHHAELAYKGADAMGFKQWSAQARMQLARLADLSGDPGALEALQSAREEYLSTGMVLARSYIDVWVASAQCRNGQPKEAIETLDALFEFTEVSKQKYFEFAAQRTRERALNRLVKQ